MKKLAIIATVVAVILGIVGGYKIYDEHDQLGRLRKLQEISRTLQREAEDIGAGSRTMLGQGLAMSTANMAQAKVNEYQEEIDLHESYQRTGYIFIGISLVLLTFGVIVLVRKKKVVSDQTTVVAQIDNESLVLAVKQEEPERESGTTLTPAVEGNHDGWIAFGVIAVVIILLIVIGASQSSKTTDTSLSAPATTVNTPAPTEEREAPKGYWQVDTDTNPVTGMVTTTAFLKYQGKQNIYIRQRGKKLELYINTDQFLETVDNVDSRRSAVQYKFDNGKVVRQSWTISDDNEALFYPGNPKAFLAQMRTAKSLAFEYQPSGRVPDTITFDVTGLPDVFAK